MRCQRYKETAPPRDQYSCHHSSDMLAPEWTRPPHRYWSTHSTLPTLPILRYRGESNNDNIDCRYYYIHILDPHIMKSVELHMQYSTN